MSGAQLAIIQVRKELNLFDFLLAASSSSMAYEFSMYIDGEKMGEVQQFLGRKKRFEVLPGNHSIRVEYRTFNQDIRYTDRKYQVEKIWKIDLDLSPGEMINLVCGCRTTYHLFGFKPEPYCRQAVRSDKSSLFPEPEVVVYMDAEDDKVQVATEEVQVPLGVTIKVTRSRTIERTVNIDWSINKELAVSGGVKQLVTASIRSEIERQQGHSYRESETMEYEVALSGQQSSRYRLVWIDVWRKGVAELRQHNETLAIPFRLRERTELKVAPIGNNIASVTRQR